MIRLLKTVEIIMLFKREREGLKWKSRRCRSSMEMLNTPLNRDTVSGTQSQTMDPFQFTT